jgi:transposase-like protein
VDLRARRENCYVSEMRKSDLICPKCHAGYQRIELMSKPGESGEFRCLSCNHLLEVFDGLRQVALRLTVQPTRTRSIPLSRQ